MHCTVMSGGAKEEEEEVTLVTSWSAPSSSHHLRYKMQWLCMLLMADQLWVTRNFRWVFRKGE